MLDSVIHARMLGNMIHKTRDTENDLTILYAHKICLLKALASVLQRLKLKFLKHIVQIPIVV